ncbi:hypothetical protein KQI77_03275 [Clostridium sp. MSJ-8]|uniref:methyl-accepting chemotaxis protein n=1 Tax=Clostridium sp. MSJ-8 TaxID=2841510 RepID=UPI001C0EF212|nr:methyl-accepting chemotaxis protein [Clostridium sp. MSJ-8]MBU5487185.1 hypothetical protein [Clostridium sp. MSJ-8]
MEQKRSLVEVNKNLKKVIAICDFTFLIVVIQLLMRKMAVKAAIGILILLILTPVLNHIAYKKKPNSRWIQVISGTGVFLTFFIALFFVDMEFYPLIIAYVAIYVMFASIKSVFYVMIPYVIMAIVKIITVVNFDNFVYDGDVATAVMMLISVIISTAILSIVANMVDKQLLISEKALADIELSNKEQKELTKTILDIVDSTTAGTDKINNIVSDINTSTKSVANAISKLAGGVDNVSQNIQNQSNEINLIQDKITSSDKACIIMSDTTKETMQVIKKGNNVVEDLAKESNKVTYNTQEVNSLMEQLSEECEEIAKITDVITDIADQTNLLALNASIEAARAGDMGKGFAVVASEVGNLADKSKESIATISQIIDRLLDKAEKSKQMVAKLVDSNTAQNNLVEETKKVFININSNMLKTEEKNNIVKKSINDVLISNEEITKSVKNSLSIAEASTAYTEETYALSNENINKTEEAEQLVKQLNENISKLKQYTEKE